MNVVVGLVVNPSPSDRKPRSQSTRYSETHPPFTEPPAAGEQTAIGAHFSYRPMHPGRGDNLSYHRQLFQERENHRHAVDHSTHSCLPILARVHHLNACKLDVDIQQEHRLGVIEFTARQNSTPDNQSRHAPGREKHGVLCPDRTPHPKRQSPVHPSCFKHQRAHTNTPEFPPVNAQPAITDALPRRCTF